MRTTRDLPTFRCEQNLKNGTGPCMRIATIRVNGLNCCTQHGNSIKRTFAAANKRWRDAGEPESDL